MITSKKDFIEISFTGKTQDGEIFDSNIEQDLKKSGLNIKAKPLIICLGEKMFLESVDEFLTGKEIGKDYTITLTPEKAFGLRDSKLVKMVPTKVFYEQQLNPHQGMMLNIDGMIAKVVSVSSGRTLVDFNNPLAGKTITYNLKIVKKVEDLDEKAKSLIEFFTRQDFPFSINISEKTLVLKIPQGLDKFFDMFKSKFLELLDLELKYEIDKTQTLDMHEHNHDHEHDHHHHDHSSHDHNHEHHNHEDHSHTH